MIAANVNSSARRSAIAWALIILLAACREQPVVQKGPYSETYRPQIHFSPLHNWTNDPNGMVYYQGVYHLFFQYYPDKPVWGPMHWGHATSRDLVHWQEQPIALYPDSLGYIFSGSAVVDSLNTSGFGKEGVTPLVAIFTHHNAAAEKGGGELQRQSLAYSLDGGKTWTKYAGNPVLHSPGLRDFRDPKVRWYAPAHKWIMTLATGDRVTFYSSPNLKEWTKESEFGEKTGVHAGVWECPDLFPLEYEGKEVWVLIVNIGSGAPNGGSGTQYFLGNFDGHQFSPRDTLQRWIDYGRDDYAGVTWSNTGSRVIFLGWMSNWQYANKVPTEAWRGAMTLPRELFLREAGGQWYVCSRPVDSLKILAEQETRFQPEGRRAFSLLTSAFGGQAVIRYRLREPVDFSLCLSNKLGDSLLIGYRKAENRYYIDRRRAGVSSFDSSFAGIARAPRLSADSSLEGSCWIDQSSAELFADSGLSVLTDLFYPRAPYDRVEWRCDNPGLLEALSFTPLRSIWRRTADTP